MAQAAARLAVPLFAAVLVAVVFAAYRDAVIDLPKKDDIPYMLERATLPDDVAWFGHSLHLNRVRTVLPDDRTAFRPGHMALVALRDIFLRDDLRTPLVISKLMLASTALVLFLVMGTVIPPVPAAALSVLFAVNHAGAELVLYPHIAPYMLSLLLLGAGLLLVRSSRRAASWAGVVVLLGATLFHEAAVVTLAVLACLPDRFSRAFIGAGKRVHLAIPVLSYVAASAIDYVLVMPASAQEAVAHAQPSGPGDILLFVMSAMQAFWAPWSVTLEPVGVDFGMTRDPFRNPGAAMLGWDYSSSPDIGLMMAGTLITVVLCGVVLRRVRDGLRQDTATAADWLGVMFMTVLASVLASVGLFRVGVQGPAYMLTASYYYGLTSFCLCGIVACAVSPWLHRGKVAVLAVVLSSAVAGTGVNAARLHATLSPESAGKVSAEREHRAIKASLPEGYCFGGIDSASDRQVGQAARSFGYLLLWDAYCGNRAGTPLYLVDGSSADGLALATIPLPAFEPRRSLELMDIQDAFVHDRDGWRLRRFSSSGHGYWLGVIPPEDAAGLSFEIVHPRRFEIMIEFKDPGNYRMFKIGDGGVMRYRMRDGEVVRDTVVMPFRKRLGDRLRLDVAWVGDEIVLVHDGLLMASMKADVPGRPQGLAGIMMQAVPAAAGQRVEKVRSLSFRTPQLLERTIIREVRGATDQAG